MAGAGPKKTQHYGVEFRPEADRDRAVLHGILVVAAVARPRPLTPSGGPVSGRPRGDGQP